MYAYLIAKSYEKRYAQKADAEMDGIALLPEFPSEKNIKRQPK